MDNPDKEKIKKLPKWAKEYIENLEEKIKNLEEKKDTLENKCTILVKKASIKNKGAVSLQLSTDFDYIPLPDRSIIKFKNKGVELRIHTIEDDKVVIYGKSGLKILPSASNSFFIQNSDYHEE